MLAQSLHIPRHDSCNLFAVWVLMAWNVHAHGGSRALCLHQGQATTSLRHSSPTTVWVADARMIPATTSPSEASGAAQPSESSQQTTYYVYCIQNQVNQRRNIGETYMHRRYQQHRRQPPTRMRSNAQRDALFDANFKMTLLSQTTSKHSASEWEYHYIRHYDTQDSSGYNITKQDLTHSWQFWYLRRLGMFLLLAYVFLVSFLLPCSVVAHFLLF